MKSNLNYRVCELSSATASCLNCVASFQYLYDVVSYMMLNSRSLVVLSRDDKGKFVPFSPASIGEYLDRNRDYFVGQFGVGLVDDFVAGLNRSDARR